MIDLFKDFAQAIKADPTEAIQSALVAVGIIGAYWLLIVMIHAIG